LTQLSPILPHIDTLKNTQKSRKTEILMRLPESKHDKERLELELERLKEENEHMKEARGELGYDVEG
jgi:hypothetical protein